MGVNLPNYSFIIMENINEEENLEQVKASFSLKLLKELVNSGKINEEV